MAKLWSDAQVLVIDVPQRVSGNARISYEKDSTDEVWHRPAGSESWRRVNPSEMTDYVSVSPGKAGSYSVTVPVGGDYLVGVFRTRAGPTSKRVLQLASLSVVAVARRARSDLILGDAPSSGGTWLSNVVRTKVPTRVAFVQASRFPIAFDQDGYPLVAVQSWAPPEMLEGETQIPTSYAWAEKEGTTHQAVTTELLAGNEYSYLVMVTTRGGEWDLCMAERKLLRRKVTVRFIKMHVHDDGDNLDSGEAVFGFSVRDLEFGLPSGDGTGWPFWFVETMDIDSGADYPLDRAYLGEPEVVTPSSRAIVVSSHGHEEDGTFFASFEDAWGDLELRLPSVKGAEVVKNATAHLDCPAHDGSIHYGVDVEYSVDYVP